MQFLRTGAVMKDKEMRSEIYVDEYEAATISKQLCCKCFKERADHDWVIGGNGVLACPQSKSDRKRGVERDPKMVFSTDAVSVQPDLFRF